MRFRKPLAAVAVAGLTVGLVALSSGPSSAGVLPPAGAPVTKVLQCFGDDSVLAGSLGGTASTSQAILDLLGAIADPPVPAPNSIEITIEITPQVPANLPEGDSSPAGFTGETILGQDLIDAAATAGITDIGLSNIHLEMAVQGGLGGPIQGDPPDANINLSPGPAVPPVFGPFQTNVTAQTTDILYTLSAVEFGVTTSNIPALGGAAIFGLSCNAPAGSPADYMDVASTFVSGIPPSTTTTTQFVPVTTVAPTTTSELEAVAATPTYTG